MPRFKLKALFYVIFILSIILGFSLRIDDLGSRPMHTDEAIQAWRLGSMIEGEGFNYRPDDGHGPVLLFLSMPAVWIKSINNYQELNEVILRSVTAIVGTLLILVMLLFKRLISIQGIAISSALVALSPMHVYYSRYYIMETPMLLFLALFLFLLMEIFSTTKILLDDWSRICMWSHACNKRNICYFNCFNCYSCNHNFPYRRTQKKINKLD